MISSCIVLLPFINCHARGVSSGNVSVLCYHSFIGKGTVPTDISTGELRNQMVTLKKEGFRFVSFSEIVTGKVKGEKNILITIDDGNRSILEAHEKVFKPMGIKPLLGIYANIIGKKEYALNWDELKQLSGEGYDIASHGHYHLLLNDELFKKDAKGFRDEIFKSKRLLEEKIGKKVEVFAYPNGVRSEPAKRLLKEAGFKYAFTIVWGDVSVPLDSNPDPLELKRYMISSNFKQVHSFIVNRLK